jgi:hypothetical protein
MRKPTDQELKQYNYVVSFVIDVKRTDNAPLNDDENRMVDHMRIAAETAIAKEMADHGNSNSKHLGTAKRTY